MFLRRMKMNVLRTRRFAPSTYKSFLKYIKYYKIYSPRRKNTKIYNTFMTWGFHVHRSASQNAFSSRWKDLRLTERIYEQSTVAARQPSNNCIILSQKHRSLQKTQRHLTCLYENKPISRCDITFLLSREKRCFSCMSRDITGKRVCGAAP